ncbi:MAG: YdcF family protein [Flavobacteriales bacterium]|nr:YdcF family protein [Flavobacteriales bacterium]
MDLLPTLRMVARSVWLCMVRWSRRVVVWLGSLALLLIVLACTRVPFDMHRWLGSGAGECRTAPEAIVVLGGSGMPSGPELLRLHHAAALAVAVPAAPVYIMHPDTGATMRQMVAELVLRGVQVARIRPVPLGENTREQALVFARQWKAGQGSVAVVTAPENMYRSVHAFRKAGVAQVCGAPAWDHAMPHDFAYRHKAIGGKAWAPDVSGNIGLRYTFWNYLKLEITCLREFAAIAYYRVNGWI